MMDALKQGHTEEVEAARQEAMDALRQSHAEEVEAARQEAMDALKQAHSEEAARQEASKDGLLEQQLQEVS